MSKKNSKNRKALVKLAKKCGLVCKNGSKHIKIEKPTGELVTVISHNVSDILATRIRLSILKGKHI